MSTKTMRPLRRLLEDYDIDRKFLAEQLGRGDTYVSTRLSGKAPWTLDECITVCDLTHTPYSEIPFIFRPDGADLRQKEAAECVKRQICG